MKKYLIPSLLMAISPTVFAQSYNGTVNDLNTVFNPPANIQGIICQSNETDGVTHSGSVCRDGVAAARWMAEKYAKKAGKYLGCIDGFTQGIWDGYQQGMNPTQDMITEAQSYVSQVRMESAVERAILRAQTSAETESADQIIRRYRAVIGEENGGKQVLPDKTPNMPQINFNGFEDGYVTDIQNGNVQGGNFNDAINAGYITASSSFADKVAARKAYYLQGEHAKSLCDVNQTIFGRRGMPQLTIWDFFKAQRQNDFQKYGWKNGSWAWDVYDKEETNLDHYQNYKGIQNKMVTETKAVFKTINKLDANGQVIPVLNPDGTPKVNADGSPVYETEEVFSHNETITRKLNAEETAVLKNLYKKAFVDSYNVYFAKQYASVEYHVEGAAKYDHAKTLGMFIGEDVAEQTTKRNAYNARYKEVSAVEYAKEAEKMYMDSFNRLIGIFENNPVVELNEARVIGTTNDGIYRPGESLQVELSVTNLGEVERPVTMRLANTVDIISNNNGHSFTPKSLGRTNTTTNIVGSVSNDLQARDRVSVQMKLDNPSNLNEISNELVVSKTQGLLLNEYAEIKDVRSEINPLTGQLDVDVQLINPSKVETPSFPNVRVRIDSQSVEQDKNSVKIAGGDSNNLLISFSGLDPLKLINDGSVTLSTYVKLGNKVTDSRKNVKIALGFSKKNAYATYFDALVTGQSQNTGGVSKEARLKEVIKGIEGFVDYALSNLKTAWKKQNEVDETIIGDLQRAYNATKAANMLNSQVQEKYTEVALLLAKKVNNKGSDRIRGLDKHYLAQLKKFAPSISTKWRTYKN